MSGRGESRIYVGNLPRGVGKRDVQDLFVKYGKVSYVSLKTGRGRPFAFVKFEDYKDAEDAVYSRNGYNFDGHRLRVEFPRNRYPRRRGRRSDYRVVITSLPATGSWQDLKDHMREAGDICHANVFKDGTGVIEYDRYDDMVYACRKLDNTLFTSHKGETSYIHVKEDSPRGRSSLARSGTRRRRTPSYSPIGGSYSSGSSRSRSRS